MKHIFIFLFTFFALLCFAGCGFSHNENNKVDKEMIEKQNELIDYSLSQLESVFSDNKELFNVVSNMLLDIDYENSIISFDKQNDEIVVDDEYATMIRDLKSIYECFKLMEGIAPEHSSINISKVLAFGEHEVVAFSCIFSGINVEFGLKYSKDNMDYLGYKKICDNWYVFKYGLV